MTHSANNRNKIKRVAVLYTRLPDETTDDQQDILDYVDSVSATLQEIGYEPVPVPATLDLADLVLRLKEMKPVFAFNLVDAIHEHDQLLSLVPSVLEAFRIPSTGVNARGNFLTTDKILAKEILGLAGIATPAWQRCDDVAARGPRLPLPCIIKPVWYDASFGMDEKAICRTAEDLSGKVAAVPFRERDSFFAEEFIDGREFNLSVLAREDGVHVLPPAEMLFVDYPPGKPKIVDFKAKWDPDSFEFTHTSRRFDFTGEDQKLLEELKSISLKSWEVFGLTGYARVDFRIDRAGKPWVLEINANPCISPDAGFIAAAEKAGLNYAQTIKAIVDDTLRREARRNGGDEHKARRRARRRVLDKKR
jgi:D-alanine-D-alanine ligase